MRSVVKIEIRTVEHIRPLLASVKQSKRVDFADGGFKTVERFERIAITRPGALLDCGHWVMNTQKGKQTVIGKARMRCADCSSTAANIIE
jgi:hypothetical protein